MLKITPYQNIKNNFQKNARSNFPRKETSFKSDFVENNKKQNNNNLLLGLAIAGIGTALITGLALYKSKLEIKSLKSKKTYPSLPEPEIFNKEDDYLYPIFMDKNFLKEKKIIKKNNLILTESGEKFSGELVSPENDLFLKKKAKIKDGFVEEISCSLLNNKPYYYLFFIEGKPRYEISLFKNNYYSAETFSKENPFQNIYKIPDIYPLEKGKTIYDIGKEYIENLKKSNKN